LSKPFYKVYSPQFDKEGWVSGICLIEIDSSEYKAMNQIFEKSIATCECITKIYKKFREHYDAGEYDKANESVTPLNKEGNDCMVSLNKKYGKDDVNKTKKLFELYMKKFCSSYDEIKSYMKEINGGGSDLVSGTRNCSERYDRILYEQGENLSQLLKSEKNNPQFGQGVSNLSCEDAKELFKKLAIQSQNYEQIEVYEKIKDSQCFCEGYYDSRKSLMPGKQPNIELYDILPFSFKPEWQYAVIDSKNQFSFLVELNRSDFQNDDDWAEKIRYIAKAKGSDELGKKYLTIIGFTANKPTIEQENVLLKRLGKRTR